MAGKRNSLLDFGARFLDGLTGKDKEVAEGVNRKTLTDYRSKRKEDDQREEDSKDTAEDRRRKEKLLGEWSRYSK